MEKMTPHNNTHVWAPIKWKQFIKLIPVVINKEKRQKMIEKVLKLESVGNQPHWNIWSLKGGGEDGGVLFLNLGSTVHPRPHRCYLIWRRSFKSENPALRHQRTALRFVFITSSAASGVSDGTAGTRRHTTHIRFTWKKNTQRSGWWENEVIKCVYANEAACFAA